MERRPVSEAAARSSRNATSSATWNCAPGGLRPHAWGFEELELEPDLLAIGKLGIKRARACFPTARRFRCRATIHCRRRSTSIRTGAIRSFVRACRCARPRGRTADGPARGAADQLLRYRVRETEVHDASGGMEGLIVLEVAGMGTRLMPESQPAEGLMQIPLARVIECRADRRVTLDDGFMPSALQTQAAERLVTFLSELLGLLHQRGEALASRVTQTDQGGAARIADFLMLQVINRYQPLVAHLAEAPLLHPEALYRLLLELAGELATFTAPAKRAQSFPAYRHELLRESFEPVIAALRIALSAVLEQSAVPIPLQQRKYGVWVGVVPDSTLARHGNLRARRASRYEKAGTCAGSCPRNRKSGPWRKSATS